MDIRTLEDLETFCESAREGTDWAVFSRGRTVFYVGHAAFESFLHEDAGRAWYPTLTQASGVYESSTWVLAVGGNREFDDAKRIAHLSGLSLATCPWRLNVDAFATDRFGGTPTQPAAKGVFPSAIILDQLMLSAHDDGEHVPGLGEALGLLTSTRDLALHDPAAATIVAMADRVATSLMRCWESPSDDRWPRLLRLASTLILKGQLTRLLGDNLGVAGCDHLIAYELRRRGWDFPHGTLVLVGTVLTTPLLCPDASVRCAEIVRFAERCGLFSPALVCAVQTEDLVDILLAAPETRPGRRTILCGLPRREADRAVAVARAAVTHNAI
jgi:glycerol dehydrogenase-like iron-containing ADH family enzyme